MTLEEEPVRAGGGWKAIASCATIGFAFFFFLIKFILFVYYVGVHMPPCVCVGQRLALSFHREDSRGQTQLARFDHYPQTIPPFALPSFCK